MPEAPEETSPPKFLATLVRGECHYLRDIRFDHGIPTVILDYHRDHLEEHAVDVVHAAGFDPDYDDPAEKVETRAKFSFTPYAGSLDVGATVGKSAARDGLDEDAAHRLRTFSAREADRLAKASTEAPRFDPEARRAPAELPNEPEEPTSAPRARPRKFPARLSA